MPGRKARRIRAPRRITVAFLGAKARFIGDLADISKTGLLMRCPDDLEPGTMGRVGIEVGYEVIRLVVKVRRRIAPIGLAFEFIQMGPHDRELLHRLLLSLESHPAR